MKISPDFDAAAQKAQDILLTECNVPKEEMPTMLLALTLMLAAYTANFKTYISRRQKNFVEQQVLRWLRHFSDQFPSLHFSDYIRVPQDDAN